MRSSQRRLLKVTRDRSFLIDRLLQYEKPITSSESEDTESSEDDSRVDVPKRKKLDASGLSAAGGGNNAGGATMSGKNLNPPKRKKATTAAAKKALMAAQAIRSNAANMPTIISDGHMTAEEVERHLQSRQPLIEMVPERAPPTVPTEMFSNEPSLDR